MLPTIRKKYGDLHYFNGRKKQVRNLLFQYENNQNLCILRYWREKSVISIEFNFNRKCPKIGHLDPLHPTFSLRASPQTTMNGQVQIKDLNAFLESESFTW